MSRRATRIIAGLALGAVVGCAARQPEAEQKVGLVPTFARARLLDASGRAVGDVSLEQTAHGVLIFGSLTGLPPGVHGFHVHAVGKCDPQFQSAGGHFNPLGRKHGVRNPDGAHAGDIPNIYVEADGRSRFEMVGYGMMLETGQHPLLDSDGAAMVLHEGPDDYRTDPAGSAGARIACGVVQLQPLRP